MRTQFANNQPYFAGLLITPKGGTGHFSIKDSPKLLKSVTDSMTQYDKDFFIKKVVRPLSEIETDVFINFDKNAITIAPKSRPRLEMDTVRRAFVSDIDERVACYPIKDKKFYNLEYETTSDAESAVGRYNLRHPGSTLVGKASAAVDIAKYYG